VTFIELSLVAAQYEFCFSVIHFESVAAHPFFDGKDAFLLMM
jgi:hypothetical protein